MSRKRQRRDIDQLNIERTQALQERDQKELFDSLYKNKELRDNIKHKVLSANFEKIWIENAEKSLNNEVSDRRKESLTRELNRYKNEYNKKICELGEMVFETMNNFIEQKDSRRTNESSEEENQVIQSIGGRKSRKRSKRDKRKAKRKTKRRS